MFSAAACRRTHRTVLENAISKRTYVYVNTELRFYFSAEVLPDVFVSICSEVSLQVIIIYKKALAKLPIYTSFLSFFFSPSALATHSTGIKRYKKKMSCSLPFDYVAETSCLQGVLNCMPYPYDVLFIRTTIGSPHRSTFDSSNTNHNHHWMSQCRYYYYYYWRL